MSIGKRRGEPLLFLLAAIKNCFAAAYGEKSCFSMKIINILLTFKYSYAIMKIE